MVILKAKGIKNPPGGLPLQAADNDAVRKQTIIPIQEMNKQHMETWKKKKTRLANYEEDNNHHQEELWFKVRNLIKWYKTSAVQDFGG